MDSKPALLTVLASIGVISLVAFLAIALTGRMEEQQQQKDEQIERNTPVDPPEPPAPPKPEPETEPEPPEAAAPAPAEVEPPALVEVEAQVEPEEKDLAEGAQAEPEKETPRPKPPVPNPPEADQRGEAAGPFPQDDPSSKALPVRGEPTLPLTDAEAERKGFLTLPRGGYTFRANHPEYGRTVEGVAVPGTILLARGLIELFGCGEGGKEYESVLRLECDIMDLDLALRMVYRDLKGGPPPLKLGEAGAGQGSRVLVFVRWKDRKTDEILTYRAEDLVYNVRRRETMARVGWTYVGSWMEVPDPASGGKKKHRILAASTSRSLLTTWRDTTTLLDNPLPDGVDDTSYVANETLLPDAGTRVLVFMRAPTEQETKEILALEKTYAE